MLEGSLHMCEVRQLYVPGVREGEGPGPPTLPGVSLPTVGAQSESWCRAGLRAGEPGRRGKSQSPRTEG